MKKYIISLFLFSFLLAPVSSFAQIDDVDPEPLVGGCLSLQNNLRYRDRDVNKNGEVSVLQDFLQSESYLNNEPTGYFGLLTLRAVKSFQKENNISPTGYVGPITRAKIKAVTCGETIPIPNPNDPVISGVSGPQKLDINQTGTWTVSASSSTGGNLSYSVVWGDEVMLSSGTTPQSIQQTATFTHSYSTAGTYKPTFTVTSENTIRCITTPCPGNGGSAKTSLSVNVGGVVSLKNITIFSPNGGEVLVKGKNQIIKWQDNLTSVVCPNNVICDPAPKQFDIRLVSHFSCPTVEGMACIAMMIPPYTIVKNLNTYGSTHSYSWNVGQVKDSIGMAFDGSYNIQVCISGSDICDSSDNYFKIITPPLY